MAAKYKNCLEYDKRDYVCSPSIPSYSLNSIEGAEFNEYEEDIEYNEEANELDEISLEAFEFLRDKVESMAVPILDQRFGLFDVIRLISAHAKNNI